MTNLSPLEEYKNYRLDPEIERDIASTRNLFQSQFSFPEVPPPEYPFKKVKEGPWYKKLLFGIGLLSPEFRAFVYDQLANYQAQIEKQKLARQAYELEKQQRLWEEAQKEKERIWEENLMRQKAEEEAERESFNRALALAELELRKEQIKTARARASRPLSSGFKSPPGEDIWELAKKGDPRALAEIYRYYKVMPYGFSKTFEGPSPGSLAIRNKIVRDAYQEFTDKIIPSLIQNKEHLDPVETWRALEEEYGEILDLDVNFRRWVEAQFRTIFPSFSSSTSQAEYTPAPEKDVLELAKEGTPKAIWEIYRHYKILP